ncbi:helix-turn-helix transcriptional regulator [Micrococcus sp.]|uniref:helix-turn-helix transcriptional regulator n=1 Tax=Micrococcus sp. TaxID=1271 RepID=UPI002A9147E8|nr:helix-turn-helix transcriptional regulator [Micrococcus sp.]MDY6054531.1 helix-turn-helix transcriptional regulator [Micrococcus sp.]
MRYVATPVRRSMRELGENLRTQRKLLGLTAQMVADRAGISAPTLTKLESGGGAGLDVTFSVLRVLGMLDPVVQASDPYTTAVGRLRADEHLPQRVRVRRES